MSNNLITIYDFEHICRTCLSRKELKPLYENCHAEMLMACTIVKFAENDGLPIKICANCISEIDQAFSFAKRCETTDTILRKCVSNIKTELADNSNQAIETEININKEIILPSTYESLEAVNANTELKPTVKEVVEDFEYVEVKQEERDEIYEDPANESSEEDDDDQDGTPLENSDNQIEEESSKNLDGSTAGLRKGKIKSKHPYYECSRCFEKFPDLKALQKHQKDIKHPPNTHSSCPICKKMMRYDNMKRHLRSHTGEKPYCCDICGASFSVSNTLNRHKLARHSDPNTRRRDFKCTECDRAFTSRKLLLQHSAIHGEKKFICDVCGKGFVSKTQLNTHAKNHSGEVPYVCDVCGKATKTLKILKNHKLIHTDERQHVCSICNKGFTHPTTLKYHMRIHTGEKPFTCEVCNKTFTLRLSLKYHMRVHTGEKPYTCGDCGKSYARNDDLTVHKRTHTGEKPYICPICGEGFYGSRTMQRHKRRHVEQNGVIM